MSEKMQHVGYFDEGSFHWMSGIAPRDCELYARRSDAVEAKPENPLAFPSVCLNDPGHPASVPGMTLRDWFAGQALGSVMALIQKGQIGDHPKAGGGPAGFAATAYDIADAMLAARGEAA